MYYLYVISNVIICKIKYEKIISTMNLKKPLALIDPDTYLVTMYKKNYNQVRSLSGAS